MISDKELDLLADLVKLFKKHGSDSFQRLAACIADPEFSTRLSEILLKIAATETSFREMNIKEKKKIEEKNSKRDFRSKLVKLSKREPEKGNILIQIHDALKEQLCLPTFRELKVFVIENNLPPVKATSRGKAIIPLMKSLVNLPTDDVMSISEQLQISIEDDDHTLQGWSEIILAGKQS